MRRKLIAGNWKMNLTRAEAVELAQGIVRGVASLDGVDVAVFPPFVYVDAVRQVLAGSNVAWGLQNVSDEPNGAFTGEISVAMARDLGCKHVIVGHSERRQKLGETDATINRKTMAALAGGCFQSYVWEKPWPSERRARPWRSFRPRWPGRWLISLPIK